MPNFNLRVELHGATPQDYKTLSTEMMRRKITDIIKSSSGKYYRLPPGEYYYSGPLNSDQVLDLAKAAAKITKRTFGVRVTEGLSNWYNLEEVTEKARTLLYEINGF